MKLGERYSYPLRLAKILVWDRRGMTITAEHEVCTGEVFRLLPDNDAFGDSVVIGIRQDDNGKYHASMARPYLYASGAATSCPTPLAGWESYEVPCTTLVDARCFRRMGKGRVVP